MVTVKIIWTSDLVTETLTALSTQPWQIINILTKSNLDYFSENVPGSIAHCKNVRGLGKSMVIFRWLRLKNEDIQMKDQLNLRVFTKNRSI